MKNKTMQKPKSIKELKQELASLKQINKKKQLMKKIEAEKKKLKGPSKFSKFKKGFGSLNFDVDLSKI